MAARGDQWLSATDASNVTIDAADQVNAFLLAGVLGEGGFVGRAGLDLEAVRAALRTRSPTLVVRVWPGSPSASPGRVDGLSGNAASRT
ncbi:MAG: hypothetical protein GXY39_02635 [Actinomycetales bacterium]|nr:hypothetical protein [Actinomycetales bacterium]